MTEDDRAALVQQAVFYRDLAVEWKATAERYRADANVAKDRVAELERADREAAKCIRELSDERDAANARAEAAEREVKHLADLIESCRGCAAESAAAALRAELDAANKACDLASGSRDAARAEVERLRNDLACRTDERNAAEGPSERAAAERKVLEAMSQVPAEGLHLWRTDGTVLQSNVAVAELALRAVAK